MVEELEEKTTEEKLKQARDALYSSRMKILERSLSAYIDKTSANWFVYSYFYLESTKLLTNKLKELEYEEKEGRNRIN